MSQQANGCLMFVAMVDAILKIVVMRQTLEYA